MRNLPFSLLLILIVNFTMAQGCLPEGIEFNYQQEIDDFTNNFPGCVEVEGYVKIWGNDITNLNGLSVIEIIGGDLWFGQCDALIDMTGLDNLEWIGGNLRGADLKNFTDFNYLISLEHIGGYFKIRLSDVLENLDGLSNLSFVGGDIELTENQSLISIEGLLGLDTIYGDLEIYGNPELQTLEGLNNVQSIEGLFQIGEFQKSNGINDLNGLNSLTSVGLHLQIWDNNRLKNLNGLDNLITLGGDLSIAYNDSIVSLLGIQNLNLDSSSNVLINSNPLLSHCHVESICGFLVNPIGGVYINNNATGCNDLQEVLMSCDSIVYIENYNGFNKIVFFPNPTSGTVNLKYRNTCHGKLGCELFDITGNKIKLLVNETNIQGDYEKEFDLSDIPHGIYYFVLKTNRGVYTDKLIKL